MGVSWGAPFRDECHEQKGQAHISRVLADIVLFGFRWLTGQSGRSRPVDRHAPPRSGDIQDLSLCIQACSATSTAVTP